MQTANTVEGFRLSPQQRRLWLQQDASGVVCSQLVLSLKGEVRIEALREAVAQVCRRHEALRTTFRRVAGVLLPVQSVEEMASSWEALDLHGLDALRIDELVGLERKRGVDYENGPIVRAKLFTLEGDRHLLSITVPALCADRRTLTNLFVELGKLYQPKKVVEDGVDAAEEEPFQYVQFSEWQNSLSEEDDAEKGREFWRSQDLSTAAVILPGQGSHKGTTSERRSTRVGLSADVASRIANLADQFETTSGTVLLAAWQTLLWRLTEKSVVIGNVADGRSYDLLQSACGLFARVLPVCSTLTEGLKFAEVVAQVQSVQRESEEWQDYFDLPATFSFGFEYSARPEPLHAAGVEIAIYHQHAEIETFSLKLTCVSTGPAIDLTLDYDSAAFDEAYTQHLAEQFQTLLASALANPDTSIEALEIVSEAERRRLLVDWNNTDRDYVLEHCVHELFEEQVRRSPDAVALVFQNEALTFAELDARADQVARYLRGQGVVTETAVGICIEPSLEMIVAVLGVLKASGAYVPLDPRNPRQRIAQLALDSGVALVLDKNRVNRSSSERGLDLQTDTRPGNTDTRPGHTTRPDSVAYIIYTSGSTGRPKGVMIQHQAVINLSAALRDEVYAGLAGRRLNVALSAPLAFDASVKQIVQLLEGHTLHILPEELRLDAPRALDYLNRHAIDVLDCTPSQLKLLLAAGLIDHTGHTPKLVLVGGEALDESTWSQLAANSQTQFFNVYGPTECTVDATWAEITSNKSKTSDPNIGRPIPNTRAYILDRNLKPTGVHVTGELYLSGAGLARGYLNSPNLTAERFIPDALSGAPGARLYRTGDLARYNINGSITFIGRNDAQVKIRGHRVELGEIENTLRQHEHVRDAVVVSRTDKADARLIAYVVAANGNAPDTNELRKNLSERLPEYMLPSFLVVLDELPLTRNGKVDRNALPAPETVKTSRAENYLAPRNEIEAAITRVWQDALGLERIGVNDNFFDAGGHSLLMVQVHSKLGELFEKNISIVEMFAKPTISALAEHFSDTNGHKPTFERAMGRAARRRQAAAMKSIP